MLATLREVIDYYMSRTLARKARCGATLGRPLHLNASDIDDIEAFLEALTDDRFRVGDTPTG